jgi:hypothetical protein
MDDYIPKYNIEKAVDFLYNIIYPSDLLKKKDSAVLDANHLDLIVDGVFNDLYLHGTYKSSYERNREILKERFGLYDGIEKTTNDLSAKFEISAPGVTQKVVSLGLAQLQNRKTKKRLHVLLMQYPL